MNTSDPQLPHLEAEHRKLYEKFLPTLTTYQEMASRCLELQIEIFKRRLCEEVCSDMEDYHLVATITARETPAVLRQLIERLEKEQIKISRVIYDPRTFSFHLYAKAQ